MHEKYNKVELLEKGVKELERKMTITSTNIQQEKQIIREIEFIKQSKPFIEEFNKQNEIIYKKKKEKYEISQPLNGLKSQLQVLRSRITELKKT